MSIDRRKLIMLLSASAAALMRVPVEAQDKDKKGDTFTAYNPGPMSFQLMLDNFGGFVIKRKNEEIKITPDEIWEALGGAK